MAWLLQLAALAAALVGHFAMTVWLFNRLHALAMPRPLLKWLEKALLVVSAVLVVLVASRWFFTGGVLPVSYAIPTWFFAALAIPLWLIPKLLPSQCPALVANDTTVVDVSQRLGYRPIEGSQGRFFARLPGNQIFEIAVQQKRIRLPRLPEALTSLRIAHLSDLHMTGELTKEFYDVAVAETNRLRPDLVLLTGDILEKEPCLSWIDSTLGRLDARFGKFFILGNHEYRLRDPMRLRQALTDVGFIDLGSGWQNLPVGGAEVLLAGNERPWFGTHPVLPRRDDHTAQFRLLLSHTPDQLSWAQANGFDLMLAGHNHGGQIRLPYLGALIAPSKYGSRYAGGLYDEPPTLLHVSRGLAGIHPIRLNCPPEIALLILEPA
jgi:predicted MPP superfamily phosphohydrolase